MRDGPKLFMMVNSTNPLHTSPQKLQFFNDVCPTLDNRLGMPVRKVCEESQRSQKTQRIAPLPPFGLQLYRQLRPLFY
ncbi:hypothetical protein DSO57_1001706 [Entomophthora muscae]|uniref:Uncharacterized protein n=1 Tax=Entomophthora muscae TaxID=34485 RepID=A0ACC2SLV5_9FUNG|nr:hypothetical protein DSO57_1001706 [Entomophthora muscae]